jgi:hypothetical protein
VESIFGPLQKIDFIWLLMTVISIDIKGKLSDNNDKSGEDLRNAITEMSIRIDQEVLLSVFESWGNRLSG